MVSLEVHTIGSIPIDLDDSRNASKLLRSMVEDSSSSTGGANGKLHRPEPLPPAGSSGPPYALVQFTLPAAGLATSPHEGNAKITRGCVCHIGGTSDFFISLARNHEHEGWEASMTIVGTVPEPMLTELVEQAIMALPKYDFVHPEFGTVMSMLDPELPVRLRARA